MLALDYADKQEGLLCQLMPNKFIPKSSVIYHRHNAYV